MEEGAGNVPHIPRTSGAGAEYIPHIPRTSGAGAEYIPQTGGTSGEGAGKVPQIARTSGDGTKEVSRGIDYNTSRRHSFRLYPTEPKSELGSFSSYIEESGTNSLLVQAVTDLFNRGTKPKNPLEWFRTYFRAQAPRRTADMNSEKKALKKEILLQESMMARLRMEETRLQTKLEELKTEALQLDTAPPRSNHEEEFRRYRDASFDPRWRIRPHPELILTKSDILVRVLEEREKEQFNIRPELL